MNRNIAELQNQLRPFFKTNSLTLLGKGEEGPVFTDGQRVFKCLCDPSRWRRPQCFSVLKSLPWRLIGYKTLPEVLAVEEVDNVLVVVSKYESSNPDINPTYPEEWLVFLQECRDARLACRNVKPGNFVRTAQGIRLVDIGSDLRELTPGEFQEMAVRSFLSWRFLLRNDLPELMRECLCRKDHPSLLGLDYFLAGLDPQAPTKQLYAQVLEMCRRVPGTRVLDYGAGKGKLARSLAAEGRDVWAWDPSWDRGICLKPEQPVRALDRAGLEDLLEKGKTFDLVVFTRVACEAADDALLKQILTELRQLTAPGGHLVFSVCNPYFMDVRRTAGEHRLKPADPTELEPSEVSKQLMPSGTDRKCTFRRWDRLHRLISRAGFREIEHEETPDTDLDLACYTSLCQLSIFQAVNPPARVSLLIKTCAMDHELVGDFIEHMVGHLEMPQAFDERVVVVDSRHDEFLRQYATPDRELLFAKLQSLVKRGIIDHVIEAPEDAESVCHTYNRWFGEKTAEQAQDTHAEGGQQIFSTLYGIDACRNDLVLALDCDLLIARQHPEVDWLSGLTAVFEQDPSAVFVAPSICREDDESADWKYETGKPYRVDPRATLFHRKRVQEMLPIHAPVNEQGQISLSWYRLFDKAITTGKYKNYRCVSHAFGFIHVPNECKKDPVELLLRMDAVERGVIPERQFGQVDLVFDDPQWWQPRRDERYVFVVAGRNVPPGKARRCVESAFVQDRRDFGIIIVDDASQNEVASYLQRWLGQDSRVTLVRNRRRCGSLFNTDLAIRRFCGNSQSVIVTLDMDDALAGSNVLSRLEREYATGADMTVGSMFGTDKIRHYLPDFAHPRSYGSNLWQHLRSFRKELFDCIPQEHLQVNGKWIDRASDWAFMVPLTEVAQSPRYIEDELYYYDAPVKTPESRAYRDGFIASILKKPPLLRQRQTERLPLIAVIGGARVGPGSRSWQLAFNTGRAIADRRWRLITGGLTGTMEAASAGARSSASYQAGGVIGLLPGLNPDDANPYVDIAIATGLGDLRNGLVANSDAVIAIGGGAGTLSEVALAWARRRLIIALDAEGWSERLAGQRIDERSRKVSVPNDRVYKAETAEEALGIIAQLLPYYRRRPRGL